MTTRRLKGFTLIELAITITVIGIVLAFSVPAFLRISSTNALKGAGENIAGQLRLAREKAIATGTVQPVHFVGTKIYHIHYPSGIALGMQWTLPNNVSFARNMSDWYTMTSDGRCTETGNADGLIPLVDQNGNLDTVFVQLSGLVSAN